MTREYNIKEPGFRAVYKGIPPFMKYENGYGYIGVLLEDEETGQLQCHLCGQLANNLAKHIYHKHKDINSKSYKAIVGLNNHTPLMSETTRRKYKNNFLNLTEDKKNEVIERLRSLNRSSHKYKKLNQHKKRGYTVSPETENKFGTCPEQAKTLFWEEYNKFGGIPKVEEMSGKLKNLVYTRFSSYREALITWGITEEEYKDHIVNWNINVQNSRRNKDFFPKFTEDEVYQKYQDFFLLNKRLPTWGEVAQYGLPGRIPFARVFKTNKSAIQQRFRLELAE